MNYKTLVGFEAIRLGMTRERARESRTKTFAVGTKLNSGSNHIYHIIIKTVLRRAQHS